MLVVLKLTEGNEGDEVRKMKTSDWSSIRQSKPGGRNNYDKNDLDTRYTAAVPVYSFDTPPHVDDLHPFVFRLKVDLLSHCLSIPFETRERERERQSLSSPARPSTEYWDEQKALSVAIEDF